MNDWERLEEGRTLQNERGHDEPLTTGGDGRYDESPTGRPEDEGDGDGVIGTRMRWGPLTRTESTPTRSQEQRPGGSETVEPKETGVDK